MSTRPIEPARDDPSVSGPALTGGTGVNEWLGAVLVGPLQHPVSAPALFVAAPLMTVAFGPVATASGIDAVLSLIAMCLSVPIWPVMRLL
jgi:hypothetical protein